MSQNWTLIGCLAKTGQDQHLKLEIAPSELYLIFKRFFGQET